MYPSVILGCCSACLVYQMHDEYNYIGQAEWLDKPHLFLHCTLCTAVVVWLCKNIISSKVCIMQIKFTLRYEIATTIIKKKYWNISFVKIKQFMFMFFCRVVSYFMKFYISDFEYLYSLLCIIKKSLDENWKIVIFPSRSSSWLSLNQSWNVKIGNFLPLQYSLQLLYSWTTLILAPDMLILASVSTAARICCTGYLQFYT